jgi:predicted nucleotidyltransferase
MSGAAGGTRISRSAVEQTVKDYTDKILSKIEGFKDAKLSGSFNRPEKEDFGDIDIIVTIETDNTKKEVKKMIGDLFQSLPDNELPPLQNPRYKGKKFINHGEMVSNLYPISGMPGEFVQVDNIISLSQEEGEFKKTILDYPAELQGLILGLIKTPLLEEDPLAVFSRLGIKDIPKAGEDQEYEFHIDTSDLTLRLVTYGENYRILNSNTVWQSKNFNDVQTLLKDYDLKGNFEDIIAKVKTLKNERSKNRVKGFFKKSIKVGAAEKGTPKGDTKQNALDIVAQLEEGFRSNIKNGLRAQFLEQEEKPRIAVFPGAFKPPHKDHVSRIIAASEKVGDKGEVLVLVSPLPRIKKGQESISAQQTIAVFDLYKRKGILAPKFNNVVYKIADVNSPVAAAYQEFERNKTQPYIAVFGKKDGARFSNIGDEFTDVVVDSFEEAGIGNTSATDLRIALLKRDKEEIAKYIPNGISVEEYLDALGLSETLQETAEEAANLWEPHAAMLARMRKQPELLKGLWKSISKPSRKALVLYFRKQNTQTENVIPVENEKASPYGSGYTLVDESLWANINAKKKRGEEASHGNSKAFKAAVKAGDALEKTKGLKEGGGEKKLRVFDFDDTLVHVDATIHVTHKDGTKSGLTPAEYAVYVPTEGDTFNFSEFSSVIKKAKPLESNIKDLIRSYNDPTEKTTILTARLLGYPVKKYLKDEFNIEPYVVGLGSSDPKDKSRWIEAQIKKGYSNIEFRDDSQKNVDAVAGLKDKYPEISIKSMLVENASYNENNKVQYKIAELTAHMKAKGMRIEPLPTVKFINGDSENAKDFFGKTAYYDPASSTIVLYTEGRHPKDIVRSFAHEMIHHMQNLEGRLENITTTNTHEDDNLNDLEKEANLKGTMTFRNWTDSLNKANTTPELQKEKVNISFELFDGTKISEDITLAMSLNSQGLFELGDNIEKYSGLTLKDAQEFNETPDDAYIYGLVNTMNDGQDIFFWTNGTRLVGNAKRIGTQTAIIEQLAHEGLHLTRAILAKSLMGDKFPTGEWPSIGEQDNDTIEEEQLTTALSFVIDQISDPFIEMAKEYIPELNDQPISENSLNEVGEANLKPYKWQEVDREGYSIYVRFETESETTYSVDLSTDKYKDTPVFLIEFSAKTKEHQGSSSRVVVNKGEMYRVMSTLTDIIKTYLQKFRKVKGIVYYPSKKGNEEFGTQRDNLYRAFIIKAIPGIKFEPVNTALYGDGIVALMPDTVVKKIVTGTEVICDNCGWEWEMENGGKDPYTCHKCGHDNTPLQEKKNKDPFGLNQYARELAQRLEETIVMEGRYDTISNQISSEIFNNWKAQFDKNNTTEEALFTKSYDLENAARRPIVFDLAASLTFRETEEGTYSVNGDADEGDEEVYDADGELEDAGIDGSIHLYFQVDPRELPRLWSKISMDLKDTVRHEIEHLTQAGYNVIPSKELPDDKQLRYYINDLGILPASNYYLLDKEIPAMLQGLYYKAKKMKRPFKEVAEAYLDIFVDNGTIDAEAKVDVLNRWRPEAKKLNLPSL